MNLPTVAAPDARASFNRDAINRVKRIQGQLAALQTLIEADQGSCEERVLRARTIEKGVTSLINHLFNCYIENTMKHDMRRDPELAVQDVQKILKLINS